MPRGGQRPQKKEVCTCTRLWEETGMRTPLKQTSTRRHGSAYKGSSLGMLEQDAGLPSSGSYAAHS